MATTDPRDPVTGETWLEKYERETKGLPAPTLDPNKPVVPRRPTHEEWQQQVADVRGQREAMKPKNFSVEGLIDAGKGVVRGSAGSVNRFAGGVAGLFNEEAGEHFKQRQEDVEAVLGEAQTGMGVAGELFGAIGGDVGLAVSLGNVIPAAGHLRTLAQQIPQMEARLAALRAGQQGLMTARQIKTLERDIGIAKRILPHAEKIAPAAGAVGGAISGVGMTSEDPNSLGGNPWLNAALGAAGGAAVGKGLGALGAKIGDPKEWYKRWALFGAPDAAFNVAQASAGKEYTLSGLIAGEDDGGFYDDLTNTKGGLIASEVALGLGLTGGIERLLAGRNAAAAAGPGGAPARTGAGAGAQERPQGDPYNPPVAPPSAGDAPIPHGPVNVAGPSPIRQVRTALDPDGQAAAAAARARAFTPDAATEAAASAAARLEGQDRIIAVAAVLEEKKKAGKILTPREVAAIKAARNIQAQRAAAAAGMPNAAPVTPASGAAGDGVINAINDVPNSSATATPAGGSSPSPAAAAQGANPGAPLDAGDAAAGAAGAAGAAAGAAGARAGASGWRRFPAGGNPVARGVAAITSALSGAGAAAAAARQAPEAGASTVRTAMDVHGVPVTPRRVLQGPTPEQLAAARARPVGTVSWGGGAATPPPSVMDQVPTATGDDMEALARMDEDQFMEQPFGTGAQASNLISEQPIGAPMPRTGGELGAGLRPENVQVANGRVSFELADGAQRIRSAMPQDEFERMFGPVSNHVPAPRQKGLPLGDDFEVAPLSVGSAPDGPRPANVRVQGNRVDFDMPIGERIARQSMSLDEFTRRYGAPRQEEMMGELHHAGPNQTNTPDEAARRIEWEAEQQLRRQSAEESERLLKEQEEAAAAARNTSEPLGIDGQPVRSNPLFQNKPTPSDLRRGWKAWQNAAKKQLSKLNRRIRNFNKRHNAQIAEYLGRHYKTFEVPDLEPPHEMMRQLSLRDPEAAEALEAFYARRRELERDRMWWNDVMESLRTEMRNRLGKRPSTLGYTPPDVQTIAADFNTARANNGYTWDRDGSLFEEPREVATIYSIDVDDANFTPETVQQFFQDNADLMAEFPYLRVGVWKKTGAKAGEPVVWSIDLNVTFKADPRFPGQHTGEALHLGHSTKQQAIFSTEDMRPTNTLGDGTAENVKPTKDGLQERIAPYNRMGSSLVEVPVALLGGTLGGYHELQKGLEERDPSKVSGLGLIGKAVAGAVGGVALARGSAGAYRLVRGALEESSAIKAGVSESGTKTVTLPDGTKAQTRSHKGNDEVRNIARAYNEARAERLGLRADELDDRLYHEVPEDQGREIADFFEDMPDELTPEVLRSYEAFAREAREQWDEIIKAGYKLEVWDGAKHGREQPYLNSDEMRRDIAENKHLYFFPTAGGFGPEGTFERLRDTHPLLKGTGIISDFQWKDPKTGIVGPYELNPNDLFRAVHDFFGHAKEGVDFGPRGEHNAWVQHVKMFSMEARPAMSMETRGQNSWVNFGRHMRRPDGSIPKLGDPDWVPLSKRSYADQKTNIMPAKWASPPDMQAREAALAKQWWDKPMTRGVGQTAAEGAIGGALGVSADAMEGDDSLLNGLGWGIAAGTLGMAGARGMRAQSQATRQGKGIKSAHPGVLNMGNNPRAIQPINEKQGIEKSVEKGYQLKKGGNYIEAGNNTDRTGETFRQGYVDVSSGRPEFKVTEDNAPTVLKGKGPQILTNIQNNSKYAYKWDDANEIPNPGFIVSVAEGGQHHFAIRVEYETPVTLRTYPNQRDEPKLRPSTKGYVHHGRQIGYVTMPPSKKGQPGKRYPIYESISVLPEPPKGGPGGGGVGVPKAQGADEVASSNNVGGVDVGFSINPKRAAAHASDEEAFAASRVRSYLYDLEEAKAGRLKVPEEDLNGNEFDYDLSPQEYMGHEMTKAERADLVKHAPEKVAEVIIDGLTYVGHNRDVPFYAKQFLDEVDPNIFKNEDLLRLMTSENPEIRTLGLQLHGRRARPMEGGAGDSVKVRFGRQAGRAADEAEPVGQSLNAALRTMEGVSSPEALAGHADLLLGQVIRRADRPLTLDDMLSIVSSPSAHLQAAAGKRMDEMVEAVKKTGISQEQVAKLMSSHNPRVRDLGTRLGGQAAESVDSAPAYRAAGSQPIDRWYERIDEVAQHVKVENPRPGMSGKNQALEIIHGDGAAMQLLRTPESRQAAGRVIADYLADGEGMALQMVNHDNARKLIEEAYPNGLPQELLLGMLKSQDAGVRQTGIRLAGKAGLRPGFATPEVLNAIAGAGVGAMADTENPLRGAALGALGGAAALPMARELAGGRRGKGVSSAHEGVLRLGAGEPPARPESGFYSRLERVIQNVPEKLLSRDKTMRADQWLGYLKDKGKNKLGVAQGELDWTRVEEFLSANPNVRLSRDWLKSFVEKRGIKVDRVVWGQGGTRKTTYHNYTEGGPRDDYFEHMYTFAPRHGTPDFEDASDAARFKEVNETLERLRSGNWTIDEVLGRNWQREYPDYEAAEKAARAKRPEVLAAAQEKMQMYRQAYDEARRALQEATQNGAPAEELTRLDRANNLAASLYVKQKRSVDWLLDDDNANPGAILGQDWRERFPISERFARSIAEREVPAKIREFEEYAQNLEKQRGRVYTARDHWKDTKNPFAHGRYSVRQAEDGTKTLHVEETQSDLHQAGRELGYGDTDARARVLGDEYEELQEELAEVQRKLHVSYVDGAARLPKEERSALRVRQVELRERAAELNKFFRERTKAPPEDVPFKNTEDWTGHVLRQAIEEAVQRGAKRIVFTPGEVHARRWKQRVLVDEIRWRPEDGELFMTRDGRAVGLSNINQENVTSARLDKILGKELAERVRQSKGYLKFDQPQHVGGQGMMGYYDGMTPKVARDYFKRLGLKVDLRWANQSARQEYQFRNGMPTLDEVDEVLKGIEADMRAAAQARDTDRYNQLDDGYAALKEIRKDVEANSDESIVSLRIRANSKLQNKEALERLGLELRPVQSKALELDVTPELEHLVKTKGQDLWDVTSAMNPSSLKSALGSVGGQAFIGGMAGAAADKEDWKRGAIAGAVGLPAGIAVGKAAAREFTRTRTGTGIKSAHSGRLDLKARGDRMRANGETSLSKRLMDSLERGMPKNRFGTKQFSAADPVELRAFANKLNEVDVRADRLVEEQNPELVAQFNSVTDRIEELEALRLQPNADVLELMKEQEKLNREMYDLADELRYAYEMAVQKQPGRARTLQEKAMFASDFTRGHQDVLSQKNRATQEAEQKWLKKAAAPLRKALSKAGRETPKDNFSFRYAIRRHVESISQALDKHKGFDNTAAFWKEHFPGVSHTEAVKLYLQMKGFLKRSDDWDEVSHNALTNATGMSDAGSAIFRAMEDVAVPYRGAFKPPRPPYRKKK